MKMRKVFLPTWVAWFLLVIFIIVLAFVYYQTFYLHEETISSFIFSIILMAFILLVVFYVVYRQVPYLLLQEVGR